MINKTFAAMLLIFVLVPWGGFARAASLPMPPVFKLDASAEQTLRAYPLGVITRQAAFSHHGKAHREIRLPNGLAGWVYDVGGLLGTTPYVSPTGKKQAVTEKEAVHQARSYTLVFDSRGVVIDVLYNENGRHDGLTALALQHRKGVLRMEEHAHPGPMANPGNDGRK